MRGKATGALVGEGAGCLSLSLSRAAAVDEDADAPRFVVDDVAEELAGRIGTCLGVRAVSVVCVWGGGGWFRTRNPDVGGCLDDEDDVTWVSAVDVGVLAGDVPVMMPLTIAAGSGAACDRRRRAGIGLSTP
jgi:hypothetical protein